MAKSRQIIWKRIQELFYVFIKKILFPVLGGGTNRIYPLPYQVSSREDGLHVCYPGKNINTGFVMTTFIDNLIFGVTSGLMGRQVVAYDELSVTLRYNF